MKRGILGGVLVVAILTLCIGPDIAWAEDTSSRIYQLESQVDDLALSSHSHSGQSSTQYYSVSSRSHGYVSNMMPAEVDDGDHFANADTGVWWDGLSPSGIDSTHNGVVFLPVQLPMGAVITEFGIVYYDEIADPHPVKAWLRRTPEKKNIATIASTGDAFTPQYTWTTSIDPFAATVDNSSYSYHIRVAIKGGLDMAIISAMVGYKMP